MITVNLSIVVGFFGLYYKHALLLGVLSVPLFAVFVFFPFLLLK